MPLEICDRLLAFPIGGGKKLQIVAEGRDRLGLIAAVCTPLREFDLSVNTITFNLVMPNDLWYHLEIEAQGSAKNVATIQEAIARKRFSLAAAAVQTDSGKPLNWHEAYLLYIGLNTADQPGLTADVTQIIGECCRPKHSRMYPLGNILHLMGAVENSGQAEGEVPDFRLNINVATKTTEVQDLILLRLAQYAESKGIREDLQMTRLNLLVPPPRLSGEESRLMSMSAN
jgi:predicted amino acid-binding ACT domain protein